MAIPAPADGGGSLALAGGPEDAAAQAVGIDDVEPAGDRLIFGDHGGVFLLVALLSALVLILAVGLLPA